MYLLPLTGYYVHSGAKEKIVYLCVIMFYRKNITQDRRSEPRVGERVPYVIVYGSPGLPLIQLVRTPSELLQDPSLRLNSTYYLTKQILPPLDRFLSLMGANVFSWYVCLYFIIFTFIFITATIIFCST